MAKQEDQLELTSSFRPIVLCLKCFGFDVHWGGQKAANCRLINHLYSLIWLLINTVTVVFMVYRLYDISSSEKKLRWKINIGILYGTVVVQIVGICVSLTMATWQDGGKLAESLHRIEARMPINKELPKKIRIASITAVAIAVILVI